MNSNIKKDAIILCGLQVSGKTTFYEERFNTTHRRISLEEYKTRAKEMKALKEAISLGESIVIDNTNTTRSHRKTYYDILNKEGYTISCYYFDASLQETLKRNRLRLKEERLPDIAIRAAYKKLEIPSYKEGFDYIAFISFDEEGFHSFEPADFKRMLSLSSDNSLHIKQFIKVVWKEKKPYFEFFDVSGTFTLVKAIGLLDLKRYDHKFCTGYYDANSHQSMPCDNETDVTNSNEATCGTCVATTGFRPCIVCRGNTCRSKSVEAKERCKEDHILYLAYFPNRVKIGVTRYERRFERMLEQGAIYSMFIGISNGKDIRKVETAIAKLGVASQVTQAYKMEHLSGYPSPTSAFSVLNETFDGIKQELKKDYLSWLIEPQFNDFSAIYKQAFTIQEDIVTEMTYAYERNFSPCHIQGEITALFGSIAIVKQNDTLTAYNLRAIEGYVVETNK